MATVHVRFVTAALALSLGLTGCGGEDDGNNESADVGNQPDTNAATNADESPSDPYEIGYTSALTGGAAFYGSPHLAGFQTYIDHLNAEGGVHGREISLNVLDDKLDPTLAITNYEQLVDDGSLAVFGLVGGGVGPALAPLAEEEEVPQIYYSLPDSLSDPVQPYVFAMEISYQDSALVQRDFIAQLADDEGIDDLSVAVIRLNTAGGEQFLGEATASIEEAGWDLATTEVIDFTASDASSQGAALANSEADFVMAMLNDDPAVLVNQALRQRQYDAPMVGYFSGSAESTFERLADPNFYTYRPYVIPATDNAGAADMREVAEAVGRADDMGDTYMYTQGYVAGMVLEAALEECGAACASGPELRDALETVNIDPEGLTGPGSFGPDDHRFSEGAIMYQWDAEAGETVPVTEFVEPN